MRTLDLGAAPLVFWEDAVYLEAALLAFDETQHLAAPVTVVVDQFPGLLQIDLESRRGVVVTEAQVAVADETLDGGFRETHNDTLFETRQNRQDPMFKALFSGHIGEVVRHALGRQVELAETLVETLGLNLFSEEFRAKQRARFAPLIARGREVLGLRRGAYLRRAEVRLTLKEWKEEVNAVRLSVYGELVGLAAQKKRPRSFAEAFFRAYEKGTSRPATDTDPVEAVGPVEG